MSRERRAGGGGGAALPQEAEEGSEAYARPKRSLGQNFLSDPNTAAKIVAALGIAPTLRPEDLPLEDCVRIANYCSAPASR